MSSTLVLAIVSTEDPVECLKEAQKLNSLRRKEEKLLKGPSFDAYKPRPAKQKWKEAIISAFQPERTADKSIAKPVNKSRQNHV